MLLPLDGRRAGPTGGNWLRQVLHDIMPLQQRLRLPLQVLSLRQACRGQGLISTIIFSLDRGGLGWHYV
jgi:hypothetical protein